MRQLRQPDSSALQSTVQSPLIAADMNSNRLHMGANLLVVINKAAPVEQLHHSFKAEHGLAGQVSILGHHAGPCLQFDGLVCFCPGKLLKPDLQ